MIPKRLPGRKLQDAAQVKPGTSRAVGRRLALTQAVRPARKPMFALREGYRIEIYKDPELGIRMPVLTAALSADKLFPVVFDLFKPLGEVVDFILESSHEISAASEGAVVLRHTWEGYGQQKNWGLAQAREPWVISTRKRLAESTARSLSPRGIVARPTSVADAR